MFKAVPKSGWLFDFGGSLGFDFFEILSYPFKKIKQFIKNKNTGRYQCPI